MLLILSLYMVHAHYSELDTIYAFAQLYLLYSYTITVYYYLLYSYNLMNTKKSFKRQNKLIRFYLPIVTKM